MSVGNSKSTFSCLGASNHSDKDRADYDFYATHPSAIDKLTDYVVLTSPIWECACGDGSLSERLEEYEYEVRSTDLIYRGYGEGEIDFLKQYEKWDGTILTNPPYQQAQEFIEHALDIITEGNEVWMFLKLTFLEGIKRKKFFEEHPPVCIWVFSKRIPCGKNGDFSERNKVGTAVCYAWFQWRKGYKGETIVKWL